MNTSHRPAPVAPKVSNAPGFPIPGTAGVAPVELKSQNNDPVSQSTTSSTPASQPEATSSKLSHDADVSACGGATIEYRIASADNTKPKPSRVIQRVTTCPRAGGLSTTVPASDELKPAQLLSKKETTAMDKRRFTGGYGSRTGMDEQTAKEYEKHKVITRKAVNALDIIPPQSEANAKARVVSDESMFVSEKSMEKLMPLLTGEKGRKTTSGRAVKSTEGQKKLVAKVKKDKGEEDEWEVVDGGEEYVFA